MVGNRFGTASDLITQRSHPGAASMQLCGLLFHCLTTESKSSL